MKEKLYYDNFVLPFMLGLVFLSVWLIIKFSKAFFKLEKEDRKKFLSVFFTPKIFSALRIIFKESLLHINLFKRNKVLGFMHASIAFGWFLIIVLGHIEVKLFAPSRWNLPYFPVFFRYFMKQTEETLKGSFFFFVMDLTLLFILVGIGIAIAKRIKASVVGMKKTTRLKAIDKIAVVSLWLIFPLRLVAESYTAQVSGGSFLTIGFSKILANSEFLGRWAWWSYSAILGIFFIALPFSRLMHIFMEPILIILKTAGVESKKKDDLYAFAQTNACSRCGVCIDVCQMASAADLEKNASIYFLRALREGKISKYQNIAESCMMCRRCDDVCPVGIDSLSLKQRVKEDTFSNKTSRKYEYFPNYSNKTQKADVVFFSGCATKNEPAILKSMLGILKISGDNFIYIDEKSGICCGKPTFQAGDLSSMKIFIDKNTELINSYGAKKLVTSCPICYNFFKTHYKLNLEILHHTQYIRSLIEQQKLFLPKTNLKTVYHDPCQLGRMATEYDAPRFILNNISNLQILSDEKRKSLCCGASTASLNLSEDSRRKIALDAFEKMTKNSPQVLATACPICKNAFNNVSKDIFVEDIAEIVYKLCMQNSQATLKERMSEVRV